VETLRKELTDLADPKHPGHELFYEYHSNESTDPDYILFHALGAWRIQPGFHDLLWNRAFTIPALQLLGGPVRFRHDQLFCKPAHHDGLDDSTRENRCLQYIPGSHRWPDLPITGLAGDMEAIHAVLNTEQRQQFDAAVAVELRNGEASFHHPRQVHGSFANHSERARRATVVNVMRDDVRSASNESLLRGVPVIPASAARSAITP
jgi:hypothetical protein